MPIGWVVLMLGWLLGVGPACQKKSDDVDPDPQPSAAETVVEPAERTTAEPRPSEESDHRPFLFDVRCGESVSYLFGTMHLGFDYQELPAWVWRRLADSRDVALETDLRNTPADFRGRTELPAGTSLEKLLGAEAFTRLAAELSGFPPEQLSRFQPWYASTLLLARLYPTALPVDLAVLREAERQKKELVFLEPLEFQLDLMPVVMTAKTLKRLLDEKSESRRLLSEGAGAYERGDYERLMEISLDPSWVGGSAATLERFIFARNDAWMKKLWSNIDRGGVFIAVGAGHLGGPRGLIAQLRAKGCTVKRAES